MGNQVVGKIILVQCPLLDTLYSMWGKRMGNQVVGKEVARRVEGAIKVNLLSTNLLILNILHSHSEKCLGKRFVKKGISLGMTNTVQRS